MPVIISVYLPVPLDCVVICRALLNLLFPEVFVHSDAFDATFDLANMSVNHQLLLKANRLLKPLMIRRVKADVEKSLPPKLETKISCK